MIPWGLLVYFVLVFPRVDWVDAHATSMTLCLVAAALFDTLRLIHKLVAMRALRDVARPQVPPVPGPGVSVRTRERR